MATILLSRKRAFHSLSRQWASAPCIEGAGAAGNVGLELIEGWNSAAQGRLLAVLAEISRHRRGWILVVNAPAPLSRQAWAAAGIDPAHVISTGGKVPNPLGLLQRAREQPGIAAVLCWQWQDGLTAERQAQLAQPARHGHQRLFLVTSGAGAAASLPALH
ncbi:hypothetical protein C7H85_04025 [Zobellella endophytica]|uniref:SOS cell division inhibitor SulA n=1 Tax=Zobellella endophytica TaxID=2116700 RepID=A0A2P7RCP9_9GAMM|nr:hypothetical protein [Zobellella endophytica]PSJ47979.1 hypothetical protein C7H85_04025 [Zobellella endophytica]